MGIVIVGDSVLVWLRLVEACRCDDQLVEVAKVVQQQGLGQMEMHQRDEAVCDMYNLAWLQLAIPQ